MAAAGGRKTKLPNIIVTAFREAMDCGDLTTAEHLFRALETHSQDREWRQAFDEARKMVIESSMKRDPATFG